LNSAQPALGAGYELDAIAAVVIGGTSLSGGEGTILGTIIGAFIISVLTNGLRILSVPQEWQMVVTGGIVIVAVYGDILRRRRQGRALFEGGDQALLRPQDPKRGQEADASAGG
jgi:ribose transport system permease protein